MTMHGSLRQQHSAPVPSNPATTLARSNDTGQLALSSRAIGDRYAFLLRAGFSPGTLGVAETEARRTGVATYQVLLAAGYVTPHAYAAALALWIAVPLAGWEAAIEIKAPVGSRGPDEHPLRGYMNGAPCIFLCADAAAPHELAERIKVLRGQGLNVAIGSRPRLEAALDAVVRRDRLAEAVEGLCETQPALSAAGPMWLRQVMVAAILAGLVVGGVSIDSGVTIAALSCVVAVPFFCVTLLRLVALREVMTGPPLIHGTFRPEPLLAQTLPVYSVLVPLFREVSVLPGLIQALQALAYPQAKLEILLVLEASDLETQAALLHMQLPANIRAIIVPDGAPRTKPKALNYALQVARGDYIVVYDAEDRPEPDQLLRALAAFERLPADIGCLQARLNIYNPRRSWFTRQFTIEYSALFDAILPALARLRLPVPLGGTSNHFRRDALVSSGAWDPFNVTEDADLGLRLARRGWRTAMLASTTWEEAPVTFRQWVRQRSRWLKGWMQTYLVHTREPRRLNAELGLRAALGLHALMGALLLSALVHPLFYVLLAYHAFHGATLAPSEALPGQLLWAVAWVNLAAGYATTVLMGMLSVWRRRRRDLVLDALYLPVTWLLISLAAYRALYQLVRDPFYWEKTEHGEQQGLG